MPAEVESDLLKVNFKLRPNNGLVSTEPEHEGRGRKTRFRFVGLYFSAYLGYSIDDAAYGLKLAAV